MSYKSGDVSELVFIAQAASKDLIVSRPVSDSCKYDVIVDNLKKILRVQIKSTSKIKNLEDMRYEVNCCYGMKKKSAYTADQVDFIAVHIKPLDLWYIIPIKEHPGKRLNFYPERKFGKWERFREAWTLLYQ